MSTTHCGCSLQYKMNKQIELKNWASTCGSLQLTRGTSALRQQKCRSPSAVCNSFSQSRQQMPVRHLTRYIGMTGSEKRRVNKGNKWMKCKQQRGNDDHEKSLLHWEVSQQEKGFPDLPEDAGDTSQRADSCNLSWELFSRKKTLAVKRSARPMAETKVKMGAEGKLKKKQHKFLKTKKQFCRS